ncbi:MAG TPA: coenzyme F420-0:L-glutamate ligase [Candidatus Bathyarchaeia archaeon]|nr:coenzyme F420-0:L-glutamate ligase [Candidatus Bathyarchaeia archaeon]
MAKTVSIVGLEGFPMVKAGDNVTELILATARNEHVTFDEGDVVVVAHKIVSKAEGRTIKLSAIKPSKRANELAKITRRDPRLVELVLREAKRVVKATSEILIVENRLGFVCINAGVDKSNVEGADGYTLLPLNPDESARQIHSQIKKLTGKKVAVVICDTYSRPFRRGQVEFAIGLAGISPFRDYRGQKDLFGYVLKVKLSAIADEIASAAELLMGQGGEATPVVVIKGLGNIKFNEEVSAGELFISEQEDLFKGTLP